MSAENKISHGADGDKASFSSPIGEVPKLVIVYGSIIMVLSAINMVIGLVVTVMTFKQGGIFVLGIAAIYFFVVIVMFRLGKGLKAGERSAVYGICILSGLAVIIGIIRFNPLEMFLIILSVMIFFAPPIISAFKHWEAFN
jgi:hypothetical protein